MKSISIRSHFSTIKWHIGNMILFLFCFHSRIYSIFQYFTYGTGISMTSFHKRHTNSHGHIHTQRDKDMGRQRYIHTLLTFILKINIGIKKPNRWNHLFDWIQQHCHLFISVCFQFSFQIRIIKIPLKIILFPPRCFLLRFRSVFPNQIPLFCVIFLLYHFTKKRIQCASGEWKSRNKSN